VPACGFANRTRAASDPACPALRPGREELATGERRKIRSLFQKTQPEAEPRPQKPRRVPRRSAERRARPQADARGNADHPWRAPYRLAGSGALIRSAGAEVFYAPLGAPPPYFIWGSFRAVAWQDSDANKKRAARTVSLILPRESGEGGPSCAARWWKGRGTRRFAFVAGISSRPAPPPPSSAGFASSGWSPSPASAGEHEERRCRESERRRNSQVARLSETNDVREAARSLTPSLSRKRAREARAACASRFTLH
jgi:hypothetical protein